MLCVQVDAAGAYTAELVTAPIREIGAARTYTVGPVSKSGFVERLAHADDAAMEQLDIALRAVFDL